MQTEEQKEVKRFELTEEQKGLIKKFEVFAKEIGSEHLSLIHI